MYKMSTKFLADTNQIATFDQVGREWDNYLVRLPRTITCGIFFNADFDGIVAAAYACSALSQHTANISLKFFPVRTAEYHFKNILDTDFNRLDAAVLLDLPVENSDSVVQKIRDSEFCQFFIFDHHLEQRVIDWPTHAKYINPTPKGPTGGKPFPSFLFAYAIAGATRLKFPEELLVTAIFMEGVDDFYMSYLNRYYALDASAGMNPRTRFSRSSRAKIGSLISAEYLPRNSYNYATPPVSIDLLTKLATGKIDRFDEVLNRLDIEFGATAKKLSIEKRGWVDRLMNFVESEIAGSADPRLIVAHIDGFHEVAGPVASVVRGKYPKCVIATYVIEKETAIFEFRTGNSQPIVLPKQLELAGEQVAWLNFGGHPSAAGASIDQAQLPLAFAALANVFKRVGFEVSYFNVEPNAILRRPLPGTSTP